MATIKDSRSLEQRREMPSALRSVIAGSTAGAVEIGEFLLPSGVFGSAAYYHARECGRRGGFLGRGWFFFEEIC